MLIVISVFVVAEAKKKTKLELEWAEITDKDWKLDIDSTVQNQNAIIIFERIIEDDKKMRDDECFRTIYRRIRILSSEGRRWADGFTPLVSEDARVVMLQGRTVLPGGTEIALEDDQVFEKEVVKTKYRKLRQYFFSIPGATDNCIVEYAFRLKSPHPIVEWLIQKDIPLLQGELRWVLSESGRLTIYELLSGLATSVPNYLWLNMASNTDVEPLPNLKDPREIIFTVGFVPEFDEEPSCVPSTTIRCKLLTYYGSERSPDAFWGELSLSIAKWSDMFCAENKRVRKLASKFDTLETDAEKITSAYHWVQDSILNTTYIELGKLEAKGKRNKGKYRERQNESVDDVMKRRYGTELDISCLFRDLLREMNIDARVTFAKDRRVDLFAEEAKYWQFDASLVAVSTDRGFVYYAPGHPFTPLGKVPWYLEGIQALVGGGVDLQAIPFSLADENTTTRSFNYHLTSTGRCDGHAEVNLKGHNAQSVRLMILDEKETDHSDIIREEITKVFSNAEIDSLHWKHVDNRDVPVRLCWQASYSETGKAGQRLLLKPLDYMSEMENPFYGDERKFGILFDYAYKLQESAQFTIPENMIVESLPRDTVYENQVGSFSLSFANFGNSLTVNRFFTLKHPFWGPQDYVDVKELFQIQQNLGDVVVVISQSSEDTVSAGEKP